MQYVGALCGWRISNAFEMSKMDFDSIRGLIGPRMKAPREERLKAVAQFQAVYRCKGRALAVVKRWPESGVRDRHGVPFGGRTEDIYRDVSGGDLQHVCLYYVRPVPGST
jgi:hypothetical protein